MQVNVLKLITKTQEAYALMPLKIEEVLTAALPIKCAEFLSLNKLLGNSVTLNDMYGYINSTEVLEAIYEAMEDELVGKDFSKSAVFVITTIKKVMASQIQKMSDEVIRNIFCELADKDVIQFIQQDEMNNVIEFVRQTPIQDMLHCTRLRDVELSELVGEAVVKVIHSRKALHMRFILKIRSFINHFLFKSCIPIRYRRLYNILYLMYNSDISNVKQD